VVVIAAFVGTSRIAAQPPNPDLPSSLPASSLPKVKLPRNDLIAINNLIPKDYAANAGVTLRSLANMRLLRETAAGPLYVIPGANGTVCLALVNSITCNDKPSDKRVLITAFTSDAKGNAIGGGLVAYTNTSVVIETDNGSRVNTQQTQGGFFITSSDHVSILHIKDIVAVGK